MSSPAECESSQTKLHVARRYLRVHRSRNIDRQHNVGRNARADHMRRLCDRRHGEHLDTAFGVRVAERRAERDRNAKRFDRVIYDSCGSCSNCSGADDWDNNTVNLGATRGGE